MNTKIEFHILQSFPPSNLNRDESNMPKDSFFGGVRRARISSQCIKRSIRLNPYFKEETEISPSDRTRRLKKLLFDEMKNHNKNFDGTKLAVEFTENLLGSMDKKNPERSSVLFFISKEEVTQISKLLLEKQNAEDVEKEYKKIFMSRTPAPDIALFGRMLAEDPKINVDAACQVAHSISTHKVDMELDFYTASESISTSDEPDMGAAMMGLTGFNSSCFYRYAAIDWEQLLSNLDNNQDLALKTVKGFMKAMIYATPTGKQNAFAANTMPYFMMAIIRSDGQAWSLANAFEKPVSSKNGYQKESLTKLIDHWQQINSVFSDPDNPPKVFSLLVDDNVTETIIPGVKSNSVNRWVDVLISSLVE
ncbi:MAG: type I-E CRISPR-associated protein Cas7/Cse4/CasC [Chloroflexi bacterium HGW-Chloroflexi-3]|nr:MAG: type I-E CRISPR-associated protein Cas7/Cse4/CasC [Chloroflexi bacterium HGW-Chloroflexi-3]